MKSVQALLIDLIKTVSGQRRRKKWFKFRSKGAEMLGAEGQAGPRRLEYDLEAGEEAHPSPKRGPAVSPAGLTKPVGYHLLPSKASYRDEIKTGASARIAMSHKQFQ